MVSIVGWLSFMAYCCILIYMFMQKYTCIYWIHTDAMNNRHRKEVFFNQIYVPLTLLQGFEKGYSRFACERVLETEQKLQYFDLHFYGRQHCVFLVLQMLNRRPRGPLCWVLAFFTASYQHLLWTPTHQGPKPLRLGVAFPTTSLQLALDFRLDCVI